ncbi:MAG TPA: phosphate signaling complex protein PhoU [Bdellovibrionota bacterium]|nr:phosphate signaling complex protein PhoU [Bdellovibrionota bacterium]
MSKHLGRELEQLKRDLLSIATLVEEAVQKAIRAFNERRADLAKEVISGEEVINQKEVEVEENCLKILALYQPVAEDLRFIAAVMKINNDLERMADYAVSIAERTQHLLTDAPVNVPEELSKMEQLVRQMVRGSLDAFIHRDTQLARTICLNDDQVDACNRVIIKEIRTLVKKDPATIDQALDIFTTTRRLERIGDLATNIAQDVIYMVEGEIVRHRSQNATP